MGNTVSFGKFIFSAFAQKKLMKYWENTEQYRYLYINYCIYSACPTSAAVEQ
ncbi:hypothetical protein [Komagataeibacter europaeus]|uniref:hypothetical protein n=1 Tax=Komagataeibacter europaeus TaxID=33995 RepID=UPI0013A07DD9|nr:hypothetical protein [Komagataeibacter europaeus]